MENYALIWTFVTSTMNGALDSSGKNEPRDVQAQKIATALKEVMRIERSMVTPDDDES